MHSDQICVIVGASHAGVNCAFALRKEGWEGDIILYDVDPELPYHRPPLSKTYLVKANNLDGFLLKSQESYDRENISLRLGYWVEEINRANKFVVVNGEKQAYDKLVLATGARPFIPPISGIELAKNVFPLRNAAQAKAIQNAIKSAKNKRVVVIGGGYIGLETAAVLKKLGASVQLLERENRILSRVTSPEMSQFFTNLHINNGVEVLTNKNVKEIRYEEDVNILICDDGTQYKAEIIIVGVGIRVNLELAKNAGLAIENGIKINASAQTTDENIYAIGDCSYHHNPHYNRLIRLESVQNAVDQAKVAAKAICGKKSVYNSIPWFWSDQYDVKLQMVGLSDGYTEALIRKEDGNCKFSIWYFRKEELLAVAAINYAKAYVLGTKFIKQGVKVNKENLVNPAIHFKPANLIEKE